MAEAPIEGDKLIDVDSLVRAKIELTQVVELIQKTQAGFKAVAAEQLKMNGGSGSIKNTDDLKKHSDAVKQANTLDEASTRLKIAEANATVKLQATLKDSESAYKRLSAEYGIALQKAKDLAAQYGVNDSRTKDAIATSNKWNNQLKQIDATLGNHQRNVGNYNAQLSTVSKTLKGFGGLGGILARAIGVDPEVFNGIREAGRAVRDLQHAKEIETLSTEENVAMKKSEIAINEEVAESESLAIPIIGVLIAAFAATAAVIIHYKEQLFGLTEAQKEKIKADDGTLISDEKLRESYNESIKKIRDLEVEYRVITGEITKYQGELENLENKNKDNLRKIEKETKEKTDDISGFWSNVKLAAASAFGLGALEQRKQDEDLDKLNSSMLNAKKALNKELTEEEKVAQAKLYAEIDKQFDENNEKWRKKREEEAKKERERRLREEKETQTELARIRKNAMDDETKLRELEDKEKSDKAKEREKEFFTEIESDRIIAQRKQKLIEDEEKEDEKNRLDRINRNLKTEESILGAFSDGLAKKESLQQASDQKMIDFHTRTAEIEATLAAGGRNSSLAAEQAAAAQAEEKKLQDAKKAAKNQQVISEIETFSKVLSAALKDSDGSAGSFFKAFAKASASEGLVAAAFSKLTTGFYEGTEAVQSGDGIKLPGSKDNIGIRVHPGERIMGVDDSAAIAGLTNDEVREASLMYMNGLYVPKTIFVDKKAEENTALLQEMRAVKLAIENKPIERNNLDGLCEWTKTIIENNMTTVMHHKDNAFKSLRLRG